MANEKKTYEMSSDAADSVGFVIEAVNKLNEVKLETDLSKKNIYENGTEQVIQLCRDAANHININSCNDRQSAEKSKVLLLSVINLFETQSHSINNESKQSTKDKILSLRELMIDLTQKFIINVQSNSAGTLIEMQEKLYKEITDLQTKIDNKSGAEKLKFGVASTITNIASMFSSVKPYDGGNNRQILNMLNDIVEKSSVNYEGPKKNM